MVCRNISCQRWGFTETRKVQIRHAYLQTNLAPYIFALTFWDNGFPGCIWCQWWADDFVIICTLNEMHLIISVRLPRSRTSVKTLIRPTAGLGKDVYDVPWFMRSKSSRAYEYVRALCRLDKTQLSSQLKIWSRKKLSCDIFSAFLTLRHYCISNIE